MRAVNAQNLGPAREQLLRDGYCLVDDAMPASDIERLRLWSDDWLARTRHPAEWKYQGSDLKIGGVRDRARSNGKYNPFKGPGTVERPTDSEVDFLIDHPAHVLGALGLGDFRSIGVYQIISKPAGGPALYWHQDWMRWDDPMSLSPWPQTVFLNWYLTETDVDNGCLRVIPGSHRRRLDLHEHLAPAHEGGGYAVDETNEWMFQDHPDAADVPVRPGQLMIGDARLLHATHANRSGERRTVLLGWYYRASNDVPADWDGEVPREILERDPAFGSGRNRQPGRYLR